MSTIKSFLVAAMVVSLPITDASSSERIGTACKVPEDARAAAEGKLQWVKQRLLRGERTSLFEPGSGIEGAVLGKPYRAVWGRGDEFLGFNGVSSRSILEYMSACEYFFPLVNGEKVVGQVRVGVEYWSIDAPISHTNCSAAGPTTRRIVKLMNRDYCVVLMGTDVGRYVLAISGEGDLSVSPDNNQAAAELGTEYRPDEDYSLIPIQDAGDRIQAAVRKKIKRKSQGIKPENSD